MPANSIFWPAISLASAGWTMSVFAPCGPALPADSDGSTHRPAPGTPGGIRVPGVRERSDGLQRHDDRRSDSRGRSCRAGGRRLTHAPRATCRSQTVLPHADDLAGPLDWKAFFGNDQPVELDVGCGRGLFLFNASTAHPRNELPGLELDYKEGRRAARRLSKRAQPNARVLGGDARVALTKLIRPQSVRAVHVYFPDPWWKRKHKRRRLFTDEFVDLAAGVLRSGGLLHSWTDVEDYFEVIRALMDHHAAFETLPPPSQQEPTHDLDYQTSFERRRRQDRRDDLSRVVAQALTRRGCRLAVRIGPRGTASDRIGDLPRGVGPGVLVVVLLGT